MPNRSKQKGNRAERQIVEILRTYGLDVYRIPLSGAVNGFKSDVEIRHHGFVLKLESKCRKGGFALIYRWLQDNDGLVIKADRADPLIILNLERFARLLTTKAPNPIENATDKPSHNPPLDSQPQETQSVSNSIDPTVAMSPNSAVTVNPPRFNALRVATEEDLRRRDEELMADRKRFT